MGWFLRLVLVGVLIMARGAPDDSNVKVGKDLYRLDDLAELAVRLGSIVTYNRAGTVLLVDGFEHGLNAWNIGTFGVGSSIVITPDKAYGGEVCALYTSGLGATPMVQMNRFIPVRSPGRLGVQVFFAADDDLYGFRFGILSGRAPWTDSFQINYHHATGKLAYYRDGPGFTFFADMGQQYQDDDNWHNIKMIIDTESGEYVRCYFDDQVFDMSGFKPYRQARVEQPMLYITTQCWGVALVEGICYVDNVIVTSNEF